MNNDCYILSVTGSDTTGGSGIQADILTSSMLGGRCVSAVTSVTVQDSEGIRHIHALPQQLLLEQVRSIMLSVHPKVAKVGMVHGYDVIKSLCDETVACRDVVLDPGIISSHGMRMVDDDTLEAIRHYLIPRASLLMLRCNEAELLLGMTISTNEEMLNACRMLVDMGAQWVLLRGGRHVQDKLTALLYSDTHAQFLTSYNVEGWQRHGVGGALSMAIATRLAFGDDMKTAISAAHDFMHNQVVYKVSKEGDATMRPTDLYNSFLSLVADNYTTAHDVTYYAERLHITPRYLSKITAKTVAKTPKQIIMEYILQEARVYLDSSQYSLQEIADLLGFSTQALFSKFFKQFQGVTPSEYRRPSRR